MIGVCVLNYENWDDTYDLLVGLGADSADDITVVVVDNASRASIPNYILEIVKKFNFNLIFNKTNGGYSYGNNIGVDFLLGKNCENIVISNNDILININAIRKMADYLNSNNCVGICAPRIIFDNGIFQEITRGVETTIWNKYKYLLKNTPFKIFVKKFLKSYYLDPENIEDIQKVHSASGCLFMVNHRAYSTIFPLDENIFLYNEELIIGDKAASNCLETVILKNIQVVHKHGKSTKRNSPKSFNAFIFSEYYYFHKVRNVSIILMTPLMLLRLIQICFKIIRSSEYREYFIKNGLR